MRAVVQRVVSGSVVVGDVEVARISKGYVVLLGVGAGDGEADAAYIVDKIANMRIFEDEDGKMNRSLQDVGGEVLLVSQFTLYGDCRKGRRPGFSDAAPPDQAERLYERVAAGLREAGVPVATGVFRAHMLVRIDNDGPVTILLDSRKSF